MSESTRKPARRTVNNSAKAEITAVKTNSYVERVMSKLKEGPEATVAKYAKDVVKFYKEQIKLAEAEIEKNQTYLEEKQEEIQEVERKFTRQIDDINEQMMDLTRVMKT